METDTMEQLRDRIAALETQTEADPDSRDLRELLGLYVQAGLTDAVQRNEHVLWYIRHHPRQGFARCPLAHIDKRQAPTAYDAVEATWTRHFDENPSDEPIALGLAAFVAEDDRPRALAILEGFVRLNPSAAEALRGMS